SAPWVLLFCSSRRRHTSFSRDWSPDVCSSDLRKALQEEVDDCVTLSQGRGVAGAAERGEHRAYYACGAVFAMTAEGAQKRRDGGDWFGFLRPLLDANRRDGVLSRDEWLNALTRMSGDPTLAADIGRMLDQGAADPAA